MEIAELVKATTIIPVSELTFLAAQRSTFGEDVEAAFATQLQLRNTEAEKLLAAATAANRDTLLASEQRSFDGYSRERDAILSLQLAIEKRGEQRIHVPESQRGQPEKPKRSGLFGLEMRALSEGAGAGMVIAPDEWSSSFIDRLAAESVMLKTGIKRITTLRDCCTYRASTRTRRRPGRRRRPSGRLTRAT